MIHDDRQTSCKPPQPRETARLERFDAFDLYVRTINQNVGAIRRHVAELADAIAHHEAILTERK